MNRGAQRPRTFRNGRALPYHFVMTIRAREGGEGAESSDREAGSWGEESAQEWGLGEKG